MTDVPRCVEPIQVRLCSATAGAAFHVPGHELYHHRFRGPEHPARDGDVLARAEAWLAERRGCQFRAEDPVHHRVHVCGQLEDGHLSERYSWADWFRHDFRYDEELDTRPEVQLMRDLVIALTVERESDRRG